MAYFLGKAVLKVYTAKPCIPKVINDIFSYASYVFELSEKKRVSAPRAFDSLNKNPPRPSLLFFTSLTPFPIILLPATMNCYTTFFEMVDSICGDRWAHSSNRENDA